MYITRESAESPTETSVSLLSNTLTIQITGLFTMYLFMSDLTYFNIEI